MDVTVRLLLRLALVTFGVTCLLTYPLALLWPSGWAWDPRPVSASNEYVMLVAIYATLGAFSLRAAAEPDGHRSLIWFAAASSLTHGLTMAVQAAGSTAHHGHLVGDVPALLSAAMAMAILNLLDVRCERRRSQGELTLSRRARGRFSQATGRS